MKFFLKIIFILNCFLFVVDNNCMSKLFQYKEKIVSFLEIHKNKIGAGVILGLTAVSVLLVEVISRYFKKKKKEEKIRNRKGKKRNQEEGKIVFLQKLSNDYVDWDYESNLSSDIKNENNINTLHKQLENQAKVLADYYISPNFELFDKASEPLNVTESIKVFLLRTCPNYIKILKLKKLFSYIHNKILNLIKNDDYKLFNFLNNIKFDSQIKKKKNTKNFYYKIQRDRFEITKEDMKEVYYYFFWFDLINDEIKNLLLGKNMSSEDKALLNNEERDNIVCLVMEKPYLWYVKISKDAIDRDIKNKINKFFLENNFGVKNESYINDLMKKNSQYNPLISYFLNNKIEYGGSNNVKKDTDAYYKFYLIINSDLKNMQDLRILKQEIYKEESATGNNKELDFNTIVSRLNSKFFGKHYIPIGVIPEVSNESSNHSFEE